MSPDELPDDGDGEDDLSPLAPPGLWEQYTPHP